MKRKKLYPACFFINSFKKFGINLYKFNTF